MYYQTGNFVPWREAAWTLLHERMRLLADRCAEFGGSAGTPAEVAWAARSYGVLAERLAAHVPADH